MCAGHVRKRPSTPHLPRSTSSRVLPAGSVRQTADSNIRPAVGKYFINEGEFCSDVVVYTHLLTCFSRKFPSRSASKQFIIR